MPIKSFSCEQALANKKENTFERWCNQQKDQSSSPNFAINRMFSGCVPLMIRPSWKIEPGAKVFTLGSCFAREVEEALMLQGINVLSRNNTFETNELFSTAADYLRRTAFLNRYNTASMLNEIKNLFSISDAIKNGDLIYEAAPGECVDLHYSPALKLAPIETVKDRRNLTRNTLKFSKADVVVITLGLIEAWKDLSAGLYLNATPGPRVMKKYTGQLALDIISYEENLNNLNQIYDLIRQGCGEHVKIIVTVSPVPLEMTFSMDDVIVANLRSKSILRAVAESFACDKDNVDYFPSYEYVLYSEQQEAWNWDFRHVKRGLVKHIMKNFVDSYIEK